MASEVRFGLKVDYLKTKQKKQENISLNMSRVVVCHNDTSNLKQKLNRIFRHFLLLLLLFCFKKIDTTPTRLYFNLRKKNDNDDFEWLVGWLDKVACNRTPSLLLLFVHSIRSERERKRKKRKRAKKFNFSLLDNSIIMMMMTRILITVNRC